MITKEQICRYYVGTRRGRENLNLWLSGFTSNKCNYAFYDAVNAMAFYYGTIDTAVYSGFSRKDLLPEDVEYLETAFTEMAQRNFRYKI